MINACIIGATGYAGIELVRLLLKHPNIEITAVVSQSFSGRKISDIYPSLKGLFDKPCEDLNIKVLADKADVFFTALPHGVSKDVAPLLMEKGKKVIDLSADYRYNSLETYEKWYKTRHETPELLKESVYGLPELHRAEIKNARLVGSPGCYPTCSILGTAPLLYKKLIDLKNIIVDAKSGVSGAGRGLDLAYHYCECNENFKAYKVASHRHTSEIEQEMSLLANEEVMITFTPHLAPMKRGILSTIYANLVSNVSQEELIDIYREFYKNEFFVKVHDSGKLPETKHVAGSNFVHIGLAVDKRTNRVIVVSTIDNLIKGAAGQAVQNMNIMQGLDEKTALDAPGLYL